MTEQELTQALKTAVTVPPDETPANQDKPVDDVASPSFDEFLPTLMNLRTLRFGKLGYVKLAGSADSMTVNFRPTRILRVYFGLIGKSAISPAYATFNSDAGNNYCNNPGSASDVLFNFGISSTILDEFGVMDIVNDAAQVKRIFTSIHRWSGTAASAPTVVNSVGGWVNTATQIQSIKIFPVSPVTIGAGSFLAVYGLD